MDDLGPSGERDPRLECKEEDAVPCRMSDARLGPGARVKAQLMPLFLQRLHRAPPSQRILLAWQASQARTRFESEGAEAS